jgi:hypothetical protein
LLAFLRNIPARHHSSVLLTISVKSDGKWIWILNSTSPCRSWMHVLVHVPSWLRCPKLVFDHVTNPRSALKFLVYLGHRPLNCTPGSPQHFNTDQPPTCACAFRNGGQSYSACLYTAFWIHLWSSTRSTPSHPRQFTALRDPQSPPSQLWAVLKDFAQCCESVFRWGFEASLHQPSLAQRRPLPSRYAILDNTICATNFVGFDFCSRVSLSIQDGQLQLGLELSWETLWGMYSVRSQKARETFSGAVHIWSVWRNGSGTCK